MNLTRRQGEALAAINEFIREHKYPPTVRELADMMGYSSPATSYQLLKLLEKKGYIKREVRKPRAIGVVKDSA